MPRIRLHLAALLLIAPALCAATMSASTPQNQSENAQSNSEATGENSVTLAEYEITVTLRFTEHGKIAREQTYSLRASKFTDNSSSNPSIRDGGRVPLGEGNNIEYYDVSTNIDITNFKSTGQLISMGVKIETNGPISSIPVEDQSSASRPVLRQARFSMSPLVVLNKTETIYSSTDTASGRKLEILLLTQRIDRK